MRVICMVLAFIATFVFGYESEYTKIAREQNESFNFDVIAEEIMDSFETDDTSVLEGYMCKNIKDNVPNLSDEISKLMDAVPGEITDWEKSENPMFSSSESDEYGGVRKCRKTQIYIYTTEGKYNLNFFWEVVNTVYPEETGIRSITLIDPTADKVLIDGVHYVVPLASITETEISLYKVPNPPTLLEETKMYFEYIINCIKN